MTEIGELAISDQWQTREVAATVLVTLARKHPVVVVKQAKRWARSGNPRLRRLASEGLRGMMRVDPETVVPVLELLSADPDPYVQDSVANLLRDGCRRHPELVAAICQRWSASPAAATARIVRRTLPRLALVRPGEAAAILKMLVSSA